MSYVIDSNTESTLEQIGKLARQLWPKADYVSISGPQLDWHGKKKAFDYYSQWHLFVYSDAKSILHDEFADSPSDLHRSLIARKLPA